MGPYQRLAAERDPDVTRRSFDAEPRRARDQIARLDHEIEALKRTLAWGALEIAKVHGPRESRPGHRTARRPAPQRGVFGGAAARAFVLRLDFVVDPCSDNASKMRPQKHLNHVPAAKTPSSLRAALVAGLFTAVAIAACTSGGGGSGDSSTSASGTGGSGGATCEPGSATACYSGPKGTEGVGICKAGVQTCKSDGTGYGPCVDEVTPNGEENCDSAEDDDCDGEVNEAVPSCCIPGVPVGCYSGPPSTKWIGICKAGTKMCNAEGTAFGPCVGEILPGTETCETPVDDDCDGLVNEDTSACCEPGEQEPCYGGPPGSDGVGICQGGLRTCDEKGGGFGPCEGQVLPEIEDCATFAQDESCDGIATCTGEHVYSKRFGDKNQTIVAAVDKAGNVYLTGSFEGNTNLGGGLLTSAGSTDVYVAKLDAVGGHVWSKRYGNSSSQVANGIAVDEEGSILVTGAFQGAIDFGGGPLMSAGSDDIFTVKLSALGGHVWSKSYGGPGSQIGVSIGWDSYEYVYIAGRFSGTVDFGEGPISSAGGDDIFLAGLDPDGALYWTKRAGALDYEGLNAMAIEPVAGDVFVTGRFPTSIDFGDGVMSSFGGDDIFVARLDYFGSPIWSKRFGDGLSQAGTGIALDTDGNVLVAGDFSGSVDFGDGSIVAAGGVDVFVAKLSSSGSPIWTKRFGDAAEERVLSVATDASDNIILTGYFQGTLDFGDGPLVSQGGKDIFVVKLKPSGEVLWSQSFGDAAFEQRGVSAGADEAGNVIVAGRFEGTVDFGGGPLVCDGTSNAFVTKLGP